MVGLGQKHPLIGRPYWCTSSHPRSTCSPRRLPSKCPDVARLTARLPWFLCALVSPLPAACPAGHTPRPRPRHATRDSDGRRKADGDQRGGRGREGKADTRRQGALAHPPTLSGIVSLHCSTTGHYDTARNSLLTPPAVRAPHTHHSTAQRTHSHAITHHDAARE